MRSSLTSLGFLPAAALGLALLTGCSNNPNKLDDQPSMLDKLPFVHKMTVQQGNLINEEMIDQIQLGMNQRQVRHVLGTPLLVDAFHPDRWDYTYTIRRGHNPMEIKRVTLWFKDDALIRIDGDLQPNPQRAASRPPQEIVVEVPDWKDDRGLFTRTLDKLGGSAKSP